MARVGNSGLQYKLKHWTRVTYSWETGSKRSCGSSPELESDALQDSFLLMPSFYQFFAPFSVPSLAELPKLSSWCWVHGLKQWTYWVLLFEFFVKFHGHTLKSLFWMKAKMPISNANRWTPLCVSDVGHKNGLLIEIIEALF